ncbi:sugar phosphate isomerase/epimerase family protein [Pedobacter punctiformis]|uniref:Sugar phosphate isomerase/epimerase n=1 Tax=Pedobacter punctiformis TaxID=3004097 RepID=A0ABT4L871_9SPHI|nr:sugar phosphate isomerase/epimerase [Pedobacter sp. HCMS5-2]MCZ4244117.1 sugar phosphate isomerase/epimerase [Pedobacter sp. HCMS5-2]
MGYNRRDFIGGSIAITAASFLTSMDVFGASKAPSKTTSKGFALKIMAPYWGFNGSVTDFCKKAKQDGYDGVEILWSAEIAKELFNALKEYQLEVGFLCRGDEPQPGPNFETFKKVLNEAIHNKAQKPLYINVHSGKDFFKYEDNKKFIDFTIQYSKETGIPIYHETHRSRMLYSAPASLLYLEENPNLRLTLDISHWCNVSESLLEDQPDTVNLAISRTDHVHARVGHEEGPQVSDPRAPEWKAAVEAHFAWWDKVVDLKKKQGKVLTMLTEFGPPSYMPTIPFTNLPVADQWAINVYMMQTWRKRYL